MKVTVTGATGFVGAHVACALAERGDEVRVTYRHPDRLAALKGVSFRRTKADVLDFAAMRRAVKGAEVVFHTAGLVASSPAQKLWELNAHAPAIAVEACAAEGVRRLVLTSTISALGRSEDDEPVDEDNTYPENWLGLAYPDSKRQGELAALACGERTGVEVVVVNPAYVLGVPVNREQPGETSTRTIGNYLRGRLPAVVDAWMNFVDVTDVAQGHLLAAEKGKPGERYILGGENTTWPKLIDQVAHVSGRRYPVGVLPGWVAYVARVRETIGLPGAISAEAFELMGSHWLFSIDKARRELGYAPRSLEATVRDTVSWYLELMAADAFAGAAHSNLSQLSRGMQTVSRLGLLTPVRAGQRVLGRRLIAGG